MLSSAIQNIIEVLTLLERFELQISELYKLAGQKWPADYDIWNQLSLAEIQHAKNMQTLAAIISARPEHFIPGRPINSMAVNSSLGWINKNITDIKNGLFNATRMLVLARDIEQSILEAKYTEIVKTEDAEYSNLVNSIVHDTVAHRKMITERISQTKS
jgi:hypothetical protein